MAVAERVFLDSASFDMPDEARSFDKGHVEIVRVEGRTFSRYTLEPGWRWADSVKPIASTESCQVEHLQYVASGCLRVRMDDGSEHDFGAGEVMYIPPGHDAWVVGDDAAVLIEFDSSGQYAKR